MAFRSRQSPLVARSSRTIRLAWTGAASGPPATLLPNYFLPYLLVYIEKKMHKSPALHEVNLRMIVYFPQL